MTLMGVSVTPLPVVKSTCLERGVIGCARVQLPPQHPIGFTKSQIRDRARRAPALLPVRRGLHNEKVDELPET